MIVVCLSPLLVVTRVFQSTHPCGVRLRAVIFANAVVDEKGERLYKDEDIAAIANYPASIVMPVFNAYNEYNGITVEKVDEAEKNS